MMEDEPQAQQPRSKLSDEQIMDIGQQAQNALNNPIFRIEYQMLRTKYFQEFVNAEPDHTKTLSWLKAKITVLDEIYGDFVSLVQHAEQVIARIQHENDPETIKQQKLHDQGFGLDFTGGAAS